MPNMVDNLGDKLSELQRNKFLNHLFRNMMDGFAYHKVLFDSEGKVIDYIFLDVNEAFEHLTGLKRENILGKKVTEALPGIEKDPADWIGIYGKVASTGESVKFENYSQPLGKWFAVSAFCPEKGYFAATFEDITERKKAEHILRENEGRIRSKLDSILSPDVDLGEQELSNIIDVSKLQAMMDDIYAVTKVGFSIIDLKDKVLVGTGWQDICTQFHRVNPQTLKNCLESDLVLTKDVKQGEFRVYKCKNNLWDIVTPLIIRGNHVGNIFSGQFFFEDETVDREVFAAQADKYGLDKEAYLAAFDRVPRWNREKVYQLMAFYTKLSEMISQLSYSNLKIAKTLSDQKAVENELRESEQRLSRSQAIAHLGSWELDLTTNRLYWSDEVYRIFGLEPQEFGATYEAFLDAVHPDDRVAVDAAYSGSLREGKDTYEIEHRIVRKATGEVRIVHEKCYHFRNEAGRIIKSVGMVHDITERKHMENALRESEQRWATTLSSIGDAVISTDVTGKITFMNAVAEELTGWTLNEALQKPIKTIFNIVNEQTRREVENPVVKVIEKGVIVGLANHTVLIRKDGSEIPIDDSGAPIKDETGKIKGVVLVFRDITERKKAEEEIAWLASFPALNPNPVVETDLDGTVQYANSAAEAVFPDIKKTGLKDLFSDWEHVIRTFKDGKKPVFVKEVKIGARWYYQSYNLTPDNLRVRIYTVNIDKLKQTEEALRKSAELARQRAEEIEKIMDVIPTAVWVSRDPDCRVITGNKAANQFYEAESSENVSAGPASGGEQNFTRRFFQNGRELKPEELPMQEAALNNKSVHGSELEVLTPSGKKRTLLGSAVPLKDNEGKARGCVASFIDITDRKQMQKKLEDYAAHLEELVNERTQQLKDAERLTAIGETAGMVGHDLRNPLQAVTGEVYLANDELKKLPDSPAKANLEESIQSISDQISYMNKIVSDLQDFVRPITPDNLPVNLKQLLNGTLVDVNIPTNIEVVTDISQDLPEVTADAQLLKRVFINLVTNAVQAMPEGGILTVRTQQNKNSDGNETVRIHVEDTGVGIAENIKFKVFRPLFTTKAKGQGFGLAVCRRVIEAHNGTITFESQESKGTTFTVELPTKNITAN